MLPVQCKMARAALGWGVRDLAKASGISTDTICRFEAGEALRTRSIAALRIAFEAAGILFLAEDKDGIGLRIKEAADL